MKTFLGADASTVAFHNVKDDVAALTCLITKSHLPREALQLHSCPLPPAPAQLRDDAKAKAANDDLKHQFQQSSSNISDTMIHKIADSDLTHKCLHLAFQRHGSDGLMAVLKEPTNNTAVMGSWLYRRSLPMTR